MPSEKKTLETPVEAEVLGEFAKLQSTRDQMCAHLYDLEREKVQVMVAVQKLDQQREKLFEKQLLDRGMSPSTKVDIDANTGVLTVRGDG